MKWFTNRLHKQISHLGNQWLFN